MWGLEMNLSTVPKIWSQYQNCVTYPSSCPTKTDLPGSVSNEESCNTRTIGLSLPHEVESVIRQGRHRSVCPRLLLGSWIERAMQNAYSSRIPRQGCSSASESP